MIKEEIANLKGYQLLDSGEGYRLEKFGEYILQRPDPAALWQRDLPESEWKKADALYIRKGKDSEEGDESFEERGNWKVANKQMAAEWVMDYQIPASSELISFNARLTPFKHTGVFPEQVANWDFISEKLHHAKKENRELKFLNLFGYTGIASVLAAKLGAKVTHVDASKPSLTDAKNNMLLSGLPEDAIRWILDDAVKFVKREVTRGNKYDAIILDPPAFGRGAKGEVWKFNQDLPVLLDLLRKICSDDFQFLIINAYAVSVSSVLLKNLLEDFSTNIPAKFIDYGELILKQNNGRLLSTGIFARLH
jgi:23S rRNA (cytosine1962-C5)-methyltransferase